MTHILVTCWRPITMLVFVFLIAVRWLGFASNNLSEAEILKLWNIVETGMALNIGGRTLEKIVPSLATIIKKDKQEAVE